MKVTDEYIASNIARLDALEDERGVSCLTDGEAMQRAALLELQQHRARIAAHATAHPERLSEDDINGVVECGVGLFEEFEDCLTGDEVRSMAIEIQQRRAADLTPDDLIEARRIHEWCAIHPPGAEISFEARRDIQRLLEKLLRAHGSQP